MRERLCPAIARSAKSGPGRSISGARILSTPSSPEEMRRPHRDSRRRRSARTSASFGIISIRRSLASRTKVSHSKSIWPPGVAGRDFGRRSCAWCADRWARARTHAKRNSRPAVEKNWEPRVAGSLRLLPQKTCRPTSQPKYSFAPHSAAQPDIGDGIRALVWRARRRAARLRAPSESLEQRRGAHHYAPTRRPQRAAVHSLSPNRTLDARAPLACVCVLLPHLAAPHTSR